MKQFLKRFALLLLLMLALATVLQLSISWRIRNKTVNGYDNLNVTIGRYDLVFLGNSRSFVQMDPVRFGKALNLKAVNLGTNGHSDLMMHRLRLDNFLARNPAPKFAILNVDPFLVPGSMEENVQMGHKNSYARYAWLPSAADEPIVHYFKFNLADRYIPLCALLRYQLLFDCITLANVNNWNQYGYNRHDEQWDTLLRPLDRRTQTDHYFDTTAGSLAAIEKALAGLDSVCIHHGIKLICVQTPVYQTIWLKRYFSYTGKLCADLKIPFFDLNDAGIDGDVTCFYNSIHLNTKGVAKMTDRLVADSAFARLFRE